MTPSLPRARAARTGVSGLVLASTVFGSVLVPAAAHADGGPGLEASLQTSTVSAAVTEATFTVRNTGTAATKAAVRFDVPRGVLHNRADARSTLVVDGTEATLATRGEVAPGQSVVLPLWVLNGAGALPEHCTIAGAAVEGCSAPESGAPETEAPETGAPETGAPETEAPETGAPGDADEDADADADADAIRSDVTYPTVTSLHSDVPVAPLGSAAAVRAEDGTQTARSDLRQAGRWIKRGQQFVVKVPSTVTDARVGIGQYGTYESINRCRDVGVHEQPLHPGDNVVTAPHDGLVSIIDTSGTDRGTVTVSGGYPVPTYIAGQTDRAAFDEQLRTWTRSPFLSLIGTRVQADVRRAEPSFPQYDQNESLIAHDDLEQRIGRWDAIVRANEAFWGAGRAAHRVHIATPSFGEPGGSDYSDAHQGWIGFPTDYAYPHRLFTGDSSFAGERYVRRAVGRVFQQDVTRWRNGFGQTDRTTSADLASIVIEEQLNGRNHLDSWTQQVQRFRATPIGQRDIWSSSLASAARPLVFDQLRRAYGDDFVARVSARADADEDRDQRRRFIRAAAAVSQRDLTRFFEEWGVTVEDDLRAELAAHPEPETAIWADFDALH